MPSAFYNVRSQLLTTNSFGQDQNCYFCTIAALLNMTTSQLVAHAQTMQQVTANADEIVALMRDAGIPNPTYATFQHLTAIDQAVSSLPNGGHVGLAYTRSDGSGHMIVVGRMLFSGAIRCIDYQASPPRVTDAFPEDLSTIVAMHLFYMA